MDVCAAKNSTANTANPNIAKPNQNFYEMPAVTVNADPHSVRELQHHFMIEEEDLPYEEELLRNPYTLRHWLRYIDFKSSSPIAKQIFLYERAVKELPGSYKIWKRYLDLRLKQLEGLNPIKHARKFRELNGCFERALVLLHSMPRIWQMYLAHLRNQSDITFTRRTFDRALRSLPITQHPRIWEQYLPFASDIGGETAVRLYRRYLKLEPDHIEDYIDHLITQERWDEAATKLAKVVNDTKFKSLRGKSQYQIWQDLCEVIVDHPKSIKTLNVDKIIRGGIRKFTDQVGVLYCHLAMYWIKLGQLEKARDVYEEGITTVMTVRDFTAIFDAYAEFEETIITAKMELAQERESQGINNKDETLDLDMRLLRFEKLMDRRPFLVNDVLLRQNPNNVYEWEKRVSLWKDNSQKIVDTYTQAISTINPKRAHGKFHELWINFAKFYEEGGEYDSVRKIFRRATEVNYKTVDDLADIWCQWAEFELRREEFDKALEVMGEATNPPPRWHTINYHDESLPVQTRVFKSLRLWSFYVDLEESLGSVDSTKAIYDRIMELRIANPQIIVNYASFLEENKYFEESFKIYERGIDIFGYPIAFEIWNTYLSKFTARYGGLKLERARDLFEQALEKCPPNLAKPLYLKYGMLEENHGLARHAMKIYDRATRAVDDSDRYEMFKFYIAKAGSSFGLVSTREIYERAIEALPDRQAKEMCLAYAEMESRLGEIDRARAIYAHASQFSDPRIDAAFWQTWHDFEVKHGNEDTFKEMLRIKRSVQAQYNTEVNFLSAQMLANRQQSQAQQQKTDDDATDEMAIMEDGAGRRVVGFVKSNDNSLGSKGDQNAATEVHSGVNPDEIEIDDDI